MTSDKTDALARWMVLIEDAIGNAAPPHELLTLAKQARCEFLGIDSDSPEDTGQFEVSKDGLKAKGIPVRAMGLFAIGFAVAAIIVAVVWAIAKLR